MSEIWMDVDAALAEVPVNKVALIDDTDFVTREESVVFNQSGMDLVWNFVTTAGAYTQTAVVPTSAGVHDWTNQLNGMYSIEIPASAGTINNDTEGFGWFTGFATGILPWTGPIIGFRAAGLNNIMIDDAFSATRGLAGTALPAAAADAAGGLVISDAGALDIDALNTAAIRLTAVRAAILTDWIDGGRLDALLDAIPTTAMRGTDGVDTATMRGTDSALTDKAGFSLSATGLDLIASTATGLVNAAIAVWDRVLTGATHNISTSAGKRLREIQELGGYELGAVYVDTNNGTAGTEDFVNGTVDNPVLSIADARTIADSIGLVNFVIRSGSSITLAQTFNNYSFAGVGAVINLGSQDVGGSRFVSTNLTGTGTGASPIVCRDCIITGAFSTDRATMLGCNLSTSSFTLTAAGKYIFDDCFNGDMEGVSQVIDFGAAVLNTDVVFRHWSGCLDIRNMGQAGTDTLVVEGMGDITFNVNCVGGTASLFGAFVLTDNSATVTITQTGELVSNIAAAQVSLDDLNLGIIYGIAQTGTLSVTQATSDLTGFLDSELVGRVIIFTGGTADGQASRITAYASASGLLTFDAITTAPANLDTFKIV